MKGGAVEMDPQEMDSEARIMTLCFILIECQSLYTLVLQNQLL